MLDVRPAAEYAVGHIAGARSVPAGELHRHLTGLAALPAGADVVAYCRGPYCVRRRRGPRADPARCAGPAAGRRVPGMEAGGPARGRGRTGGTMTSSEAKAAELFTERYRIGPTDVTRRIERAVIGGDWGANGYTTLAQAGSSAPNWGWAPGSGSSTSAPGRGGPACTWRQPPAARSCSPTCPPMASGRPRHAPGPRAWRRAPCRCPPAPGGCRSPPAPSTGSRTPTCCVDCVLSSPC